jgi:outer membrane protein assembly factor BamB
MTAATIASVAIGQLVQPPQLNQGNNPRSDDQDSVTGVYLPTDRSLSRAMGRARERLADREYHEALAFLQGILGRGEDSFLERAGDDRGQLGLKATARQMIGELPPEGRDAYELLQGPAARRQLEAALKNRDRDGIANIVRQYFHTQAGYEATLVLAQMETDQGHRLAAAQLYQELINAPRAADRFEPQLSVAAALNQLAAGRSDDAANTIKSLSDRKPAAAVELFGKQATLPAAGADPLEWLTGFVGAPAASASADNNWLTLHGDPSRNIQSPGGEPHLRPRWEARVVNEPAIESFLTGRTNDFVQRGVVAIPGARPIAVGDVVVMRTPENVVAVDWITGKRIWETRDEQELDSDEAPSDLAARVDNDQWSTLGKPLEERMWDDALATALSSDGNRVFVVRGVSPTRDEDSIGWQFQPGFGRIGIEAAATTNQLAAYDLATQGKLAWELDGERTAGTLAGAFFLGPPVAIDNTLFVMAEIRMSLYLLALDPITGQVEWQQRLIELEQGIAVDPARRRVGATPSYSGGILVCPTGASAAIAIDIVKREFAWVYRYAREAQSTPDANLLWQQRQLQNQLVRANDQWLDNSAIIADGCVLLTPPESAEIHCLELHTGKLLWKRRQGDALFVGGVDHGNVLLVGSQAVQALRLSDGATAWKVENVSLPTGALPAGQGYLSEGRYYLPLTSGQIAEIEMASGDITQAEPANPNVVLGNLICYRGSVLSQSPLVLSKFEQLDLFQKRTESALAENPRDANAIRELAEIKNAAGEKPEAVRLLKSALELAPHDVVTQELLAELLLDQLASDYSANRADVPLVARLIRSREQQIELLRIDAAGIDKSEKRLNAWDAYLKLADFTAEEPAYLRIDDQYTVRSDRWISSRLSAIWSTASTDQRQQIADKISARRPSRSNSLTSAELRHYLAHLGQLPGADDVRLTLANNLVERDRRQEAEIELLQLVTSPDRAMQVAASELMAKSYAKPDQHNDGSSFKWPRGHVEAESLATTATVSPQNRERPARQLPERQTTYRQLRLEQDFWPGGPKTHWFVAMDSSEIVGRNTLGDDVFRWTVDQSSLLRQSRDSGLVHGARLGHLLFFTLGGQVMAIDSRQDRADADGNLLWPSRASDDFSGEAVRPRRGVSSTQNRTARPPVYHGWSGRRRIAGAAGNAGGSLGPVTPLGVVYQDQDELKCVEPVSGIVLWSRRDLPVGCELFGDGNIVFAADIGNKVAYALRLCDGEMLGKRELPKLEWLLTSGRNIAQLGFNSSHGNRVIMLTVTDIWSQKTIYQTELPVTARVSVIEPNLVAAFDPSGKFTLLDVEDGRLVIDQKLEAASDFQSIQTLKSGDQLYLCISGQVNTQFKPIGQPAEFPLVNGPIYAFSLKTGEPLWPGPALIRNRGIVLAQPEDIPFLVFADRQTVRDATNGGGTQLRLLCVDKRTGQTVYRNEALPDTSPTRFRVRGEADSHPSVALEMSAGKIQLAMTDRPRPPQPPANDDLEAPREIVERGLRGLGQRIGSAWRGALEKPVANQARPQPQPQLQNGQNKPNQPGAVPPPNKAPEKAPDTDDD